MGGRLSNLVWVVVITFDVGVGLDDVLVELDSSSVRYRMFLINVIHGGRLLL
jgi:hypothetical protein